jgi:hypothetical protein
VGERLPRDLGAQGEDDPRGVGRAARLFSTRRSASRIPSTRSGCRSSMRASRSSPGGGTTTRWRFSSRSCRPRLSRACTAGCAAAASARTAALAAAAILASFEPLYSAFLTGLAEVPLVLRADALRHGARGRSWKEGVGRAAAASRRRGVDRRDEERGAVLRGGGCAIALALGGRRGGRPRSPRCRRRLVVQGCTWRGAAGSAARLRLRASSRPSGWARRWRPPGASPARAGSRGSRWSCLSPRWAETRRRAAPCSRSRCAARQRTWSCPRSR